MAQVEQQFYQESFRKAVEQYMTAHANCRYMAEKLMELKRQTISKKLFGKEFSLDELYSDSNWRYSYYDSMVKYKAVKITTDNRMEFNSDICSICRNSYDYTANLRVFFLRNPQPLLDSKAKPTGVEKALLKKLLREYNYNDEKYVHTNILDDTHRELQDLKHKYNMLVSLEWSWHFEDMLADDFFLKGLIANRKIC